MYLFTFPKKFSMVRILFYLNVLENSIQLFIFSIFHIGL